MLIQYYIKIKGSNLGKLTADPVGNGEWMMADGRQLKCSAYPKLYAVLKNDHCPRKLKMTQTRIQKLFRLKLTEVHNPNYKEGFFALPEVRRDNG